jgi:hypothetical protein
VKVVGMSPLTFAPGVKNELGTEKLFKSMLGRVYTVRGFGRLRRTSTEAVKYCLGRARISETSRMEIKQAQTQMRTAEICVHIPDILSNPSACYAYTIPASTPRI